MPYSNVFRHANHHADCTWTEPLPIGLDFHLHLTSYSTESEVGSWLVDWYAPHTEVHDWWAPRPWGLQPSIYCAFAYTSKNLGTQPWGLSRGRYSKIRAHNNCASRDHSRILKWRTSKMWQFFRGFHAIFRGFLTTFQRPRCAAVRRIYTQDKMIPKWLTDGS